MTALEDAVVALRRIRDGLKSPTNTGEAVVIARQALQDVINGIERTIEIDRITRDGRSKYSSF